MHPFTRATEMPQPPSSRRGVPLSRVLAGLLATVAISGSGCQLFTTELDEIPAAENRLAVTVEYGPHRPPRDVARVLGRDRERARRDDRSHGSRDRLAVVPPGDPDTVRLRKTWPYRSEKRLELLPGRHATFPIHPKVALYKLPEELRSQSGVSGGISGEFPVGLLSPGDYHVIATVNETWHSPPCPIQVGIDPPATRGPEERTPRLDSRSTQASLVR